MERHDGYAGDQKGEQLRVTAQSTSEDAGTSERRERRGKAGAAMRQSFESGMLNVEKDKKDSKCESSGTRL